MGDIVGDITDDVTNLNMEGQNLQDSKVHDDATQKILDELSLHPEGVKTI